MRYVAGGFIRLTVNGGFSVRDGLCGLSRKNPVSLVDHLTAGNPFILYPNPASDFVNLDLPKEAIRSVRIFDSSGVLVKEVFDNRFSVAELKDGFYSGEVMRDTGKLVFRLVRK